jgi:ABC-2 type transport system ATP-binding protein
MIEAHGLRREFGDRVAVDDVSLCVPDGSIVALLGPNGAGKTTTVRLLSGLLSPTAGQATVAGFDVRSNPAAVRARIGLVTDSPGLYDQMTPDAYLDFFGKIYGVAADLRRRRIDELLAMFELRDVHRRRMAGFSRGMQQKVALARALLHDPAVVFLDEPTAGLDPMAARAVRSLIVRLKHASRSIVLCTHDLDEAERLADMVVILRRGRIVAADAPAALRAGAARETRVDIALAHECADAARIAHAIDAVLDATQPTLTTLTYRTAQPRATNPRVIAALVAAGAEIVAVTCQAPSLEDVYADVVQSDTVGASA